MPFVCETCGKTYKHSGALSKHNDAQHRGIRHQCTKCGALYVRKEDMVKHMKKCAEKVAEKAIDTSDLVQTQDQATDTDDLATTACATTVQVSEDILQLVRSATPDEPLNWMNPNGLVIYIINANQNHN